MGSWVCGCGFVGVSVDKFDTDLFGEGKFNLLAVGFSESSGTFLDGDFRVFDGGNLDGTFFLDGIALDNGQADGFVDAGLLRGGVGNSNGDIDGGDNRDIVGGFLGNFLAVVVSVTSVSVSAISVVSGLADSDHLDIGNLLEGNFDGFGNGVFADLFVRVGADFLWDYFDGFNTDGLGDGVSVWDINDNLDGEGDIVTFGGNGWGTDLSDFSHVNNGAVVFGFFITVSVVRGRVTVSRGGVMVSRGGVSVNGGGVSVSVCGSGVGWASKGEGEESQDSECLKVQKFHINTLKLCEKKAGLKL